MNARSGLWRDILAIALMSAAIACVFLRPRPIGGADFAADYNDLHKHRMDYGRWALLNEHVLPGWYTRELLGTPFWSNVSNFPFIPNRLIVLLLLDPYGRWAWTVSATLSAILAGLFTFLFIRKIGLGPTASAAAGFTFAASGFFACHLGAGQMSILEGYGALPLLLWATESLVQARTRARWIIVLAISAACVSLCGHPQLPAYAMVTAAVYALWRGSIRATFAMAGGILCAGAALLPMVLLILRSTRVLPLDPAPNNLAMPLHRLLGFFAPWLDGAPVPLPEARITLFHGYASVAYFWDTFCYTGLLPWLAAALLLGWVIVGRSRPRLRGSAMFLVLIGVLGIILCLPYLQSMMGPAKEILLRSPARIIYLTEFSLAAAVGGAIQWMLTSAMRRWLRWIVPVLLILHGLNLFRVDRQFQVTMPPEMPFDDPAVDRAVRAAGADRVGIELGLDIRANRRFDDVGYYDSIALARPYRLVVDLSQGPPGFNRENIDAAQMPLRALEALGVACVITRIDRPDLELQERVGPIKIYRVPRPMERAVFCPIDHVIFLDTERLHAVLRDSRFDAHSGVLIPSAYKTTFAGTVASAGPEKLVYRRPDSDHIECTVVNAKPGYLRLIESWDPGWSATIDGQPAVVVPAMDALLAVALEPGQHEVRFAFHTPGRFGGILLSILGLTLLSTWISLEFHKSKAKPVNAPAKSSNEYPRT